MKMMMNVAVSIKILQTMGVQCKDIQRYGDHAFSSGSYFKIFFKYCFLKSFTSNLLPLVRSMPLRTMDIPTHRQLMRKKKDV